MACRRRRYNVAQALQAVLESGSEDTCSDDYSPGETSSSDADSESDIEDIRARPVNHGGGVRTRGGGARTCGGGARTHGGGPPVRQDPNPQDTNVLTMNQDETRRGRQRGRGRGRARGRGRGRGVGRRNNVQQNGTQQGAPIPPIPPQPPQDPQDDSGDDEVPCEIWTEANKEAPVIPNFVATPGIQVDTTNFVPLDFFKLYISEDMFNYFVTETNRFAQQHITSNQMKTKARGKNWVPVTVNEMKQFLGLLLLMGILRKPDMQMYWSQHPLFATPLFPGVMSRDRFLLILKFWHFNDNANMPQANAPNSDRLYKIRPLVDELFEKFQTVYTPDVKLSLDEELMLWKGRLIFKQYLPLKRARFGIKIFCLCESSGYTYRFRIYTGKEDQNPDIARHVPDDAHDMTVTESIVLDLMLPLLNKGYHLYTDNYYSSVRLFRYLDQHETGCCGTVRSNRVPHVVKNKNLARGESAAYRNEHLLLHKFRDKKDVYVLSNLHDESTVRKRCRGRTETYIEKPVSVNDYNQHMGGVDKVDQLIQPYDATRRSMKWYRKLAVHLIQVAMLNACILQQKNGGQLNFLKFQTEVLASLIFSGEKDPDIPKMEHVVRLTERHFLMLTPETDKGGRGKKHLTRKCRVCRKKGIRREVMYLCAQCPSHPALCPFPCFEKYHTKINYYE